jgi:hypothetical protein
MRLPCWLSFSVLMGCLAGGASAVLVAFRGLGTRDVGVDVDVLRKPWRAAEITCGDDRSSEVPEMRTREFLLACPPQTA